MRIVSQEPLVLFSEKRFAEICEKLRHGSRNSTKKIRWCLELRGKSCEAFWENEYELKRFRRQSSELARQGKIVAQGELIKKPGTEVTLTAEEAKAKEQITQAFLKAGLDRTVGERSFVAIVD